MSLSRRWSWVAAMAAGVPRAARRSSAADSCIAIEQILKGKLATIFEDPAGEDEVDREMGSSDGERAAPTRSSTAVVARKGGDGWRKVKELQRRFKKCRLVGSSSSSSSRLRFKVYFLAGFAAKGLSITSAR